MKASELRELTVDELNSKHKELKEEFMRIRCNTVLSADSDVHQMKKNPKGHCPNQYDSEREESNHCC